MSLLNIQENNAKQPFSIFALGFRPFFLGAGIFAPLSIALWTAIYSFGLEPGFDSLPMTFWHAHEMIYGYAMAVIAGFLLTAIKNWTGVQTLHNKPLMVLFAFWAVARLAMLAGQKGLWIAAVSDLIFGVFLFIAALLPIVQVRQWKQAGIVAKLLLMLLGNLVFYGGALGWLEHGIYQGVYIGIFLVIALILTMARRVLPFFIERGVGYPVSLKNAIWLDMLSLFGFVAFALNQIFFQHQSSGLLLAILLFCVTTWRLINWYTPGIWRVSLLWGLYAALIAIDVGFLLYAIAPLWSVVSHSLALHAMAFGGVGLITVSMMSRVTLGHTGRNVQQPSRWIAVAQIVLVLGLLLRVVFPLFFPMHYANLILAAQIFWISAFLIFLRVNLPMLTRPRVDGAAG